jgi:hypothetical protein
MSSIWRGGVKTFFGGEASRLSAISYRFGTRTGGSKLRRSEITRQKSEINESGACPERAKRLASEKNAGARGPSVKARQHDMSTGESAGQTKFANCAEIYFRGAERNLDRVAREFFRASGRRRRCRRGYWLSIIRKRRSEISNQKSAIRNQQSEISNQKSAIRNQRSEVSSSLTLRCLALNGQI